MAPRHLWNYAWHGNVNAGTHCQSRAVYFDQPAGMMQRMAAMLNVYNAFKVFKASSGNLMALANSQPQVLALVRDIERMENEHDG